MWNIVRLNSLSVYYLEPSKIICNAGTEKSCNDRSFQPTIMSNHNNYR